MLLFIVQLYSIPWAPPCGSQTNQGRYPTMFWRDALPVCWTTVPCISTMSSTGLFPAVDEHEGSFEFEQEALVHNVGLSFHQEDSRATQVFHGRP
ncbi:hypothetical protein QBC37DRAFT_383410 [Rhypophila decipiens]|uniref:Uncharacterized protein n=1 Tax=Rhypophila decipiens TaxID=261697 RepID=A0AAN6YFX0_9PEZI|nr:hypothetical protein QBC37DRAFT_383410 [Rhypophila decipiens]